MDAKQALFYAVASINAVDEGTALSSRATFYAVVLP